MDAHTYAFICIVVSWCIRSQMYHVTSIPMNVSRHDTYECTYISRHDTYACLYIHASRHNTCECIYIWKHHVMIHMHAYTYTRHNTCECIYIVHVWKHHVMIHMNASRMNHVRSQWDASNLPQRWVPAQGQLLEILPDAFDLLPLLSAHWSVCVCVWGGGMCSCVW